MISQICKCLEILLEGKHSGPRESLKKSVNKEEAVLNAFRENIHLSFKEIESYNDLKSTVYLFINPCSDIECTNCDILNFFQLCIVLLKLIHQSLLKEENEKSLDSKPKGLLSISQQVIVKKCLQFIVALGIVPNLIPGIGIPRNKRLEYPEVLTNLTFNNTPQQKYLLLVMTAETLLECQNCDALQSIIMSYHGSDLLSTLMQLCFAPIKKIDKKFDCKSNRKKEEPKNSCFKEKLSLLKEPSPYEENHLIWEMQQKQVYFKPFLDKFMKEMCPSLLMFDLLMFNGMSKKSNKGIRTPLWFKRECNLFMKKLLLGKHGIATLVKAVLNQTFDMDTPDITTEQIESLNKLAQVVIFYPVAYSKEDTVELQLQSKKQSIDHSYLQDISKQVLDLLCGKGQSGQHKAFSFVASSIILQVSEFNLKLAEECFWDVILKPLEIKIETDSDAVIKEEEFNSCIENLANIFLLGDFDLSQHQIKVLWPYFQILFHLMCLVDNISFVKSQIKQLLCKILTLSDDENALSFLQSASFPKEEYPTVIFFCMETNERVSKIVDFDYFQNRCNLIFDLLDEVKSKILNSSYLLFILENFCLYHKNLKEGKEEMYNEIYCLCLALLTQNITDWKTDLGEAALLNMPEVVSLLMTLLENSCNEDEKDEMYDENIIMTILAFLSSFLVIGDKLTSSHWEVLQKCIPSLNRLQKCNINPELKVVLFNILANIATHGASTNTNTEAQVIRNLSSNHSKSENTDRKTSNTDESTTFKESKSGLTEANLKQNLSCKNFKLSTFENDVIPSAMKSSSNSKLKYESHYEEKFKTKPKSKNITAFEAAMKDVKDSFIPTRGHGLVLLGKLIKEKDEETVSHKEEILNILQENLECEDSYIYLAAIQTLSFLAQLDSNMVIPVALKSFLLTEGISWEFTVKMGEVLIKICRSLGDVIHKYQDKLLHAFLVGAKNSNPIIRSSSLSNLGEVCLHLKFNIGGPWLQEILTCVQSLLCTDKDKEVQRCAMMAISLILRGVGKDMLQVLENHIKDIYTQLRFVSNTADDEVLRLHSQLALEEINVIMRDLLTAKQPLVKEIRIL